jgi:hypothetical protein
VKAEIDSKKPYLIPDTTYKVSVNNELLGLKRVSMRNGPNETLGNRINTSISFDTPEHVGKHKYILYLVSDGYLGLDQQIEISFETRMDLDS